MLRPRVLSIVITLLAVAVALACSSSTTDFARALRLERGENPVAALAIYQRLLAQVPSQERSRASELYFHMGECLWRLERPTESFVALEKALTADPHNLGARLRLGELYLGSGSPERAREQASEVLQITPSSIQALSLLGAASALSGRIYEARDAFQRVLDYEPQRVNVALALADIYHQQGDSAKARAILRAAASAQPRNPAPWLALARMAEEQGDPTAAEESYRRAVAADDSPETNLRLAQFLERNARVQEARELLRHVDSTRPAIPSARADFDLFSGRAGDAVDAYLAAIRATEGQKSRFRLNWRQEEVANLEPMVVKRKAALAARLIEAEIVWQRSPRESAAANNLQAPRAPIKQARAHLDEYRQQLDPATAAILEAEISLAEGNVAIASLRAAGAVALAPQSPAAHYVLGVAKSRAGDAVGARAEWLAAVQADSAYLPAQLALASQALKAADAPGAKELVLPVVREEPGNMQALLEFARVLAAEKSFDAAAMVARRAAALDSIAAAPHVVLGDIALQQRRLAEALVEFEKAIVLEPHSAVAVEGLVRVYRQGVITKAMLRKLEWVAGNPPASGPLMEIAGRLYAGQGWRADAQRCLTRALQIDPQRATASQALAQVHAASGNFAAALDSVSRSGARQSVLLTALRAEQQRDFSTAIRNYESAVRSGDTSGVAANNLAWLYAQQGRNLDRALALAKSAQVFIPRDPAALDTLGVVYLKRREFSQAIETLQSAKRLAASGGAGSSAKIAGEISRHLQEAYFHAGQTPQN